MLVAKPSGFSPKIRRKPGKPLPLKQRLFPFPPHNFNGFNPVSSVQLVSTLHPRVPPTGRLKGTLAPARFCRSHSSQMVALGLALAGRSHSAACVATLAYRQSLSIPFIALRGTFGRADPSRIRDRDWAWRSHQKSQRCFALPPGTAPRSPQGKDCAMTFPHAGEARL
jgi:hypothetical protein